MEKLIYYFEKYKLILIISTALLIIVGMTFFRYQKDGEDDGENIVVSNDNNVSDTEQKNIKINIKGAVLNPGVYELNSDARVEDAINIAGGLQNDADTSIINLSKRLNDESVIIIYTKEEVKKIKSGNVVIQYIEKECNCPNYKNEACIDPDTLVNVDNNNENNTGKISINKANLSQLQTLPGIGKTKAQSIIDYRNKNGLFKSITDLKKVNGIGNATFENIKEYITL